MCQSKDIKELDCESPLILKVEQFLVRVAKKIGPYRKKFRYYKKIFVTNYLGKRREISLNKEDAKDSIYSSSSSLKAGDIVRVRSKEQIMQTLDENKRLEGCYFRSDMWQYCGGEYKVFKRVDYFFDESSSKMRKARNMVLLEGLYCSGELPMYFKHRCDRSCFFFWKDAWLEKVK
jgi:hypothetical protein